MGKKLYVGSLPFEATEDQLRELFEPHGAIDSIRIIMDKFSGRSKGFGFVEFADDDAAQKAIEAVNGKELGGRALVVNEARPEMPRAGGGGYRGGGGGGGFNKGPRKPGGFRRGGPGERW